MKRSVKKLLAHFRGHIIHVLWSTARTPEDAFYLALPAILIRMNQVAKTMMQNQFAKVSKYFT